MNNENRGLLVSADRHGLDGDDEATDRYVRTVHEFKDWLVAVAGPLEHIVFNGPSGVLSEDALSSRFVVVVQPDGGFRLTGLGAIDALGSVDATRNAPVLHLSGGGLGERRPWVSLDGRAYESIRVGFRAEQGDGIYQEVELGDSATDVIQRWLRVVAPAPADSADGLRAQLERVNQLLASLQEQTSWAAPEVREALGLKLDPRDIEDTDRLSRIEAHADLAKSTARLGVTVEAARRAIIATTRCLSVTNGDLDRSRALLEDIDWSSQLSDKFVDRVTSRRATIIDARGDLMLGGSDLPRQSRRDREAELATMLRYWLSERTDGPDAGWLDAEIDVEGTRFQVGLAADGESGVRILFVDGTTARLTDDAPQSVTTKEGDATPAERPVAHSAPVPMDGSPTGEVGSESTSTAAKNRIDEKPAAGALAGRTVVYTDGACSENPGPGGWGWVVPDGESASGGAADTTNQRMELTAVLEAVRSIQGPLHIVSDSTYVVNCFRDSWWKGWLQRDWKNSQNHPVANRDLWEPLIDLYQDRDVTFEWVKGHSGDRWNERADELAIAGRDRFVSGSRESSPSRQLVQDIQPLELTDPDNLSEAQHAALARSVEILLGQVRLHLDEGSWSTENGFDHGTEGDGVDPVWWTRVCG